MIIHFKGDKHAFQGQINAKINRAVTYKQEAIN